MRVNLDLFPNVYNLSYMQKLSHRILGLETEENYDVSQLFDPSYFILFFFLWSWESNLGFCTCKANSLSLRYTSGDMFCILKCKDTIALISDILMK